MGSTSSCFFYDFSYIPASLSIEPFSFSISGRISVIRLLAHLTVASTWFSAKYRILDFVTSEVPLLCLVPPRLAFFRKCSSAVLEGLDNAGIREKAMMLHSMKMNCHQPAQYSSLRDNLPDIDGDDMVRVDSSV